MAPLDLRLRGSSPGLLALPWLDPLAEWQPTEVPFRDIPVGPSRHLVRFVETDGQLWALKELPRRIAAKEYAVLRDLERRDLPAVRAAGLVVQPQPDTAILVTRYLDRSWQYRRLLMRIPVSQRKHRERLLDAMATLLVDLHRNGVFWGDCSLANTLFSRDGQLLQAWLVDAETSEIHPELSDGQRRHDMSILVENVAGGLLDLAVRLEQPPETYPALFAEAAGVEERYDTLWEILHAEPIFSFPNRYQIEHQIRRLHELGFAVDEVNLQPAGGTEDNSLRLTVAVAARQYHSTALHDLTGLEVGEGQANVLLADLLAYQSRLRRADTALPDDEAQAHEAQANRAQSDQALGRRWLTEVLEPRMQLAHSALGGVGDAIQAYCDLLEVRWLLSEQAGRDVGDGPALEALARRSAPAESAATLVLADTPTVALPVLSPHLLAELDRTIGGRSTADPDD